MRNLQASQDYREKRDSTIHLHCNFLCEFTTSVKQPRQSRLAKMPRDTRHPGFPGQPRHAPGYREKRHIPLPKK